MLYRSGVENFYDAVHADMASALAPDSLLLFGIEWHFQDRPDWKPMIALADFIKVDRLTTSLEDQLRFARAYLPMRIRMLAQKVEPCEDFHRTQLWGLHLFQGYFFSRPEMRSRGDIHSNQLNYLLVLQAVNREQMDISDTDAFLAQRPAADYAVFTPAPASALSLASITTSRATSSGSIAVLSTTTASGARTSGDVVRP